MSFNVIAINKARPKNFLKFFFRSNGSLSEKAVRGSIWLFLLRFTDRFFRFGRTIILARLLSPNDFGVFGIALLALAALDTFSQVGFKQALIQKKEEIKSYLDTTWTMEVIKGLLIAAFLFITATYIAKFFGSPESEPILKVIGLAIVIQGFTNSAVVYFEKKLDFKKFFKYQFAGTVVDFIVAVTFALVFRSVWALVVGLIVGNFVRMVMSYLLESYRPSFNISVVRAKELFKYGKWILGSSILLFLLSQGDGMVVGKILGVTALGFYQVAYRISNLSSTEISQIISKVTFPAYSKLQDNLPKLRDAYFKILQITAFFTIPVAGLISILAYDFTLVFLGTKWLPIVPLLQVLSFSGLFWSLRSSAGTILLAVGKPELNTKLQILQLFIMASLIYPFVINLGAVGAALAVLLSGLVSYILLSIVVVKTIKFEVSSYVSALTPPLINMSIVYVLALGLKTVVSPGSLRLVIITSLGVLTYLAITFVLVKLFNYKAPILIRNSFRLITGK